MIDARYTPPETPAPAKKMPHAVSKDEYQSSLALINSFWGAAKAKNPPPEPPKQTATAPPPPGGKGPVRKKVAVLADE
jgi:hypothetical protein